MRGPGLVPVPWYRDRHSHCSASTNRRRSCDRLAEASCHYQPSAMAASSSAHASSAHSRVAKAQPRITLLAVVGLEHTGHHLWHNALAPRLTDQLLPQLTGLDTYTLQSPHVAIVPPGRVQGWAKTTTNLSLAMASYSHRLRGVVAQRRTERDALKPLSLLQLCSYPCGDCTRVVLGAQAGGSEQPDNLCGCPNVVSLTRAAEDAGFNMRLLVLSRRSAIEVIRDDGWPISGMITERAALLAHQCRHMLRELRQVEDRIAACMDYHEPHKAVAPIATNVGLDISNALKGGYRPASAQKTTQRAAQWQLIVNLDRLRRSWLSRSNRTKSTGVPRSPSETHGETLNTTAKELQQCIDEVHDFANC